jgi:hypothetical protein
MTADARSPHEGEQPVGDAAGEGSGAPTSRAERIRELLDRFDRSGAHFRESGRQAGLGVREALLVLEQLADEYGHTTPALRQVSTAMLLARGVVDLVLMRMAPLDDALRTAEIRLDALGILRDLLEAELMRQAERDAAPEQEAWATVLAIVDREIDRLAAEAAEIAVEGPRTPQASVEWIEVEE